MGNNHYEKDYDDEVYEDDYYDEHYEEEELAEDSDTSDPVDSEDDNWDDEKKIVMSFACEDCDYRWEDQVVKSKDAFDEDDDPDVVCPMCGSMNVTQI